MQERLNEMKQEGGVSLNRYDDLIMYQLIKEPVGFKNVLSKVENNNRRVIFH